MQEKYSILLEKNNFRLTEEREQGTYILKPKPYGLYKTIMAPANEHVTMQIASQVYNIPTAENGLVFFQNNEPAYDLLNTRIHVEEEGFFALQDELFKEWRWSDCRIKNPQHHLCREDFIVFGKTIGITESRVNKLVEPFLKKQDRVEALVKRSFLDEETMKQYMNHYNERWMMLNGE